MADSKKIDSPATGQSEQGNSDTSPPGVQDPESIPSTTEDRRTLLDHAGAFLTSPDIVHEEAATKRRFLSEKGLRDDEIEGLLQELPAQVPVVPPRTYPQAPPSNLPHLLLGLTKILTWLTGGSIVLTLIYYRFLLPRLTRSALARRSLKQHQVSLLKRLNSSLSDLKATQAETLQVLPPEPEFREPAELADTHSLDKLGLDRESIITVPPFTILRCATEGLAATGKKATKEELFTFLEEWYSWLKTDESLVYQNALWETLSNNPCFSQHTEENRHVWTYTPPPPPAPTALESSLTALKSSFPPPRAQPSPIQRTLDTLADFTGYITTQTYQLASGTMRLPGISGYGSSTQLSPQQEEVKKEIRALKGLVLNRRTFAPTAIRPSTFGSTMPTPQATS